MCVQTELYFGVWHPSGIFLMYKIFINKRVKHTKAGTVYILQYSSI